MIGKDIFFFNSLTSTNDYVKSHLDELEEGSIIVAKSQHSGRGRRGNQWISNEGNLFFSVRLKKHFQPFYYVMKASVDLVHAMEAIGLDAMVKYPNDILVGGRKIAGVLIEIINDDVVLGIGVNVQEKQFETLTNKATSLFIETTKSFDPLDVLDLFIHVYKVSSKLNETSLFEQYKTYSFVLNKQIKYKGYIATITDITKNGLLKINYNNTFTLIPMDDITLEELYYD
jgi:BirA family biotin operon repressor/biotin-[acetyl-CoA-carboxylase] ligase